MLGNFDHVFFLFQKRKKSTFSAQNLTKLIFLDLLFNYFLKKI